MSEIKVSAGLVSPEASPLGLPSLCVLNMVSPLCVRALISSPNKDTSHVGLGSTPVIPC